jgi:hypothetical protein
MPVGRRSGEPIVGIGPRPGLVGVFAGCLNLRCQRRELVAAALADDRERLGVLEQPERQFVWPSEPVTARNGCYSQPRSIYAT